MSRAIEAPHAAIELLGIPVHDVTMDETVAWIGRWIAQGGAHQIATVNPEFLVKAREDPAFARVLRRASLCIPDGFGVVWAARLRGRRLRERVAGSDLVPRLAHEAAEQGWRVFFLGAAPGVAERAAAILSTRYPDLKVAGCYPGSPAGEEEDAIVNRVRAAHADLLLVAYGAPNQDLWLGRNLSRTGAPVGIGVGGSFDFVAGVSRRAPRWIQRIGLEWLYRLAREPQRWRRQLALPKFVALILLGRDGKSGESENGE
jgi:N-acetylglucosaminyldiphosphoundecaprenol N-acetyl-beta-D-mannosaminyltransferase